MHLVFERSKIDISAFLCVPLYKLMRVRLYSFVLFYSPASKTDLQEWS